MSIMNKLLGDIVEASGGEITNSGSRNGLLRDWLDAESQVCVPLWQPNGVNQQLSINAPVTPGVDVRFTLVISAVADSIDTIFDTSERTRVRLLSVGTWDIAGGSLMVNGLSVSDNDPLPSVGSIVKCVFTSSTITNLLYIGSFGGTGVFSSQSIYDLSIGDGSVYNFPLDDGFANNPTARNLGSGADGTFINNDAASWGERCE